MEKDFLQFFHKNYKKEWFNEERIFKRNFKSVENIAKKIFKTDINKGLDISNNNDILWRKQNFGENEYISKSKSTFLDFLLISIDDFIIRIIFFLSIIIIVIDIKGNGIKEGVLTIISLLVYLILMSFNDYNLFRKALEIEKQFKIKSCKLIRNNTIQTILNKDLLVGDILVLNKGDIVETDGFFINDNKIGVDESPLFQGAFKYKIQYKSSKFEYNKNTNEFICPFIFASSYIVEGNGYLLVAALGKNIYKNRKIYFDILNDNNKEELNNTLEEYEYFNEIGYYKLKVSLFSEKIASFGMFILIALGFILVVKNIFIINEENKSNSSLEYISSIINGIIYILIFSLLAVPNNINMIDFISYLSYEKNMLKNNIYMKQKKYPELAFIDTFIILDNENNFIFKDEKKKEVCDIIKNLKNCGINVILITEKNFENSIIFGNEFGIIDKGELNRVKKIKYKYTNLDKNNSICIESDIFNSLYGKIEVEKSNDGKETITFSNIEYFKKAILNLKILSKAKMQDKIILINGLAQLGKKICITGTLIDDLKLLKIANISFGSKDDLEVLKENYSLILLNNSLSSFFKAYEYSFNLNYKINQYIEFFIMTFFTPLIIDIIGIFIFKNLPISKFIIIYLKIFVDLFAPYIICNENSCKSLLNKTKNIPKYLENINYINIIFKIIIKAISFALIMTKGINLFQINNKNEYDLWNDENGFYFSILFIISIFMMNIHLLLIIFKSHHNIINSIFYFTFILIFQFFSILLLKNYFNIYLVSQTNIIICFFISFTVNISSEILNKFI